MDDMVVHKYKNNAYYKLKEKLLEINKVDSSDVTALMLAILNNSYTFVELLLTHGANFRHVYKDKITLIHLAVHVGNLNIVKLLLDFETYHDSLGTQKVS